MERHIEGHVYERDTRRSLIDAAERLFARGGVASPSLREVARLAGARNVAAVQYHFGDRDGLVNAILDKHLATVDAERHRLLDDYEAGRTSGLHALAAALVRPYARKLDDADGGPEFLQVYADLLNRAQPLIEPGALDDPDKSLYRWRRLVDPLIDDDAIVLHRRFTATAVTITELARRARAGRTDHRLFVSTLVDTARAIIAAPTSAETRELLADRVADESM